MYKISDSKPLTITDLGQMKAEGEKIACLTAYDASFAAGMDAAGVEVVLVGDSLGMVVQGHETTVPVSMEQMIYHCRCVARGLRRGFLIGDMPFLSFRDEASALTHAHRFLAEGHCKMVKLEGGGPVVEIVAALTARGVGVCAHLGLTPQWVHKLGGYRMHGKSDDAAQVMRREAKALEQAGAQMLVLECVPAALASEISQSVAMPVIGIGAGGNCDGQILVSYDMLDITPGRRPRFSRNFMDGQGGIVEAFQAYVAAVKDGSFPSADQILG